MYRPRLQLLAHTRQQHQHLLLTPFHCIAEQAQREGFEPVHDLRQVAQANVLEVRVFGPGPDGDLVARVVDVLEPGVEEVALEVGAGGWLAARQAGGFEQGVDPDEGLVVLPQAAVFRVVLEVEVLELDPAAGFESAKGGRLVYRMSELPISFPNILVHVSDEFGPVENAGSHVPAKDVVKRSLVQPGALDVVYFELDVGWQPRIPLPLAAARLNYRNLCRRVPCWLDGAKIVS